MWLCDTCSALRLVEPAKAEAASTFLSSGGGPGYSSARQEGVLGLEALEEAATLLTSLNKANKLQILAAITILSRYHKEAL